MATLFDTVKAFFEEDEWEYECHEDDTFFRVRLNAENGVLEGHGHTVEDRSLLIFYTTFPVKVAAEKRSEMAELLTRINDSLRIGNFEMTFDTGAVYFRSGVSYAGLVPSTETIKGVVYNSFSTMDDFIPVMMSVIYGGVSPMEALRPRDGSMQ